VNDERQAGWLAGKANQQNKCDQNERKMMGDGLLRARQCHHSQKTVIASTNQLILKPKNRLQWN
jgi:hypothetical protein